MADQYVRFPDYDAAALQRGLTAGIWADCPLDLLSGPQGLNEAFLFFDDFLSLVTGRYTATAATAGTFALTDAKGGVAIADSGATTNTQGITELRCPDPACNPYLAFSVKLAAGLEGIKKKTKLADPVEEDLYKFDEKRLASLNIEVLPSSLFESINELHNNSLMGDVLGEQQKVYSDKDKRME